MSSILRIDDAAPPVAVLTLNRPERRNALSLHLVRALRSAFDSLAARPEIHVVILRAEGKVFCSGHDLAEMTGRPENEYRELFDECSAMMLAIQRMPQPVIAEVHGVATAAGCQLVAACDLAVAADDAWFATPGVKIGIFCTTPAVPLVRAIGRKRAMQMLLTGKPVDAPTAADWGLINEAVPPATLRARVDSLAAEIGQASSSTVAIGKHAFYHQLDLPDPDAYHHASRVMTSNATTPDAQEGIRAFLEKRTPVWTHQR